ncbi:golvesin C-terminal-like domain-containing protein [Rubrobacter tropicus]|uniref:golvesin C-terminal-like domain-containing protein n=1 Tax=Rubrobacter tropicus TaxID=2653851 RepID=UPI00140B7FDD|nr:NlpC/P60 family protein [Rubrobacter tropicus]
MRRLIFVACAVFAAMSLVSLATLSAEAQSVDQYAAPDQPDADVSEDAPPAEPAAEASVQPPPPPADVDEPDAAGLEDRVANTVAKDPYSQVVDDTTRGRFSAPGWKREKATGAHGGSLHGATGRQNSDARFKVKVPTAGYYTLYARWPANAAKTVRIGVSTPAGVRWEETDQAVDGSAWVRVGAFRMAAGDRYSVLVSPGKKGDAVADAVMISKNVLVGKNAQMVSVGSPVDQSKTTGPTASGKAAKGSAIVSTARRHIGRPYDYDHAPCRRAMSREDCSCLTRNVLLAHGIALPDSPVYQWYTDRGFEFRNKSLMRPGDLVFHDLNKDRDLRDHYTDHVAIYSGNGNIIHASSYFGKVVESKERYLKNFWGAKRLVSR